MANMFYSPYQYQGTPYPINPIAAGLDALTRALMTKRELDWLREQRDWLRQQQKWAEEERQRQLQQEALATQEAQSEKAYTRARNLWDMATQAGITPTDFISRFPEEAQLLGLTSFPETKKPFGQQTPRELGWQPNPGFEEWADMPIEQIDAETMVQAFGPQAKPDYDLTPIGEIVQGNMPEGYEKWAKVPLRYVPEDIRKAVLGDIPAESVPTVGEVFEPADFGFEEWPEGFAEKPLNEQNMEIAKFIIEQARKTNSLIPADSLIKLVFPDAQLPLDLANRKVTWEQAGILYDKYKAAQEAKGQYSLEPWLKHLGFSGPVLEGLKGVKVTLDDLQTWLNILPKMKPGETMPLSSLFALVGKKLPPGVQDIEIPVDKGSSYWQAALAAKEQELAEEDVDYKRLQELKQQVIEAIENQQPELVETLGNEYNGRARLFNQKYTTQYARRPEAIMFAELLPVKMLVARAKQGRPLSEAEKKQYGLEEERLGVSKGTLELAKQKFEYQKEQDEKEAEKAEKESATKARQQAFDRLERMLDDVFEAVNNQNIGAVEIWANAFNHQLAQVQKEYGAVPYSALDVEQLKSWAEQGRPLSQKDKEQLKLEREKLAAGQEEATIKQIENLRDDIATYLKNNDKASLRAIVPYYNKLASKYNETAEGPKQPIFDLQELEKQIDEKLSQETAKIQRETLEQMRTELLNAVENKQEHVVRSMAEAYMKQAQKFNEAHPETPVPVYNVEDLVVQAKSPIQMTEYQELLLKDKKEAERLKAISETLDRITEAKKDVWDAAANNQLHLIPQAVKDYNALVEQFKEQYPDVSLPYSKMSLDVVMKQAKTLKPSDLIALMNLGMRDKELQHRIEQDKKELKLRQKDIDSLIKSRQKQEKTTLSDLKVKLIQEKGLENMTPNELAFVGAQGRNNMLSLIDAAMRAAQLDINYQISDDPQERLRIVAGYMRAYLLLSDPENVNKLLEKAGAETTADDLVKKDEGGFIAKLKRMLGLDNPSDGILGASVGLPTTEGNQRVMTDEEADAYINENFFK